MASLKNCLDQAVRGGEMTRERADELIARADGFATQEVDAAQKALDSAFAESALKRKQAALQIQKMTASIADMQTHPRGVRTGINTILGRDVWNEATWENVDQLGDAIRMDFLRRLADPLNEMRAKWAGLFQDRAVHRKVVRGIFGDSAGDAKIQSYVKAVKEVLEDARVQFNKAGGHILKRENWFPQSHDARLLSRASDILGASDLDSRPAWVSYVMPKLERKFMMDDVGVPMTDDQLTRALGDVYDSIATDGIANVDPLKHTGTTLANRHRDARFLVFKDADSWMEYNNKFGNPDLLTTMTDYLTTMANEIALLERMGPNPSHTYRAMRGISGTSLQTEALWNAVSGKANEAMNLKFATASQGLRNFTTATRLGSAMLSAVSDLSFMQNTSMFNALNTVRMNKNYVRLLNPANSADRLEAARGVGIIDNWTTKALAANRFSEVTGAGWTAKLADSVMRVSGLSAHTNVAQQAVALEVFSTLAEQVGKSLDELPERFPLKRFMSEVEWDVLRSTPVQRAEFGNQIDLDAVMARADIDDQVKRRTVRGALAMAKDMANKAVPMPDARSRAITTGGHPRGTVAGETFRFVAQFKGFPISVIMQHLYAGLAQATTFGKARYLGQLTVMTTIMGALALQLKEISKGRDPIPPNTAEFWGRAFAQGGGAGIYGDFLMASMRGSNRFGQGPLLSMLGPTAGTLNDVAVATFGQLPAIATGDLEGVRENLGDAAILAADRYVPGLSSLWYTRVAYERLVVDTLRDLVDQDAAAKNRRKIRRAKREQKQEYWWRPGEALPDRSPEIL